jgi:glycosyltransferase involved in cell wall biosynthesis
MKPKVLFFIPNRVGGAENITILFYKLLKDLNINCQLVIIKKAASKKIIIPEDVSTLTVRNLKFSVFKLNTFVKSQNPDFLFTSSRGIGLPLSILAIFFNYKIILRHSFMPNRYHKFSLPTIGIRFLYPYAYKIIAQTEEMKKMMIEYYKLKSEKITVIHNPIDYQKIDKSIIGESPYEIDVKPKFITVGNVRFVKGHDILLAAFKKVLEIIPTANLFIVGKINESDPYYLELKKFIINNNIQNNVQFVGFSTNPYKYIHHADSFVLSSRSEGLPNVIIEALYLKKPIVATRCVPFIDQVISDGINGFKVESENASDLAAAMLKSLQISVPQALSTYNSPTSDDINSLFNL